MMRVSGIRSPVGTRETERRSAGAVNMDAIPFLPEPYKVYGVEKYGLIGDAPKDYVVCGANEDPAYIAKKPRREGPIECVTEYLIACVGTMLPLRLAEARLAKLRTAPGAEPDVRFLSRQFLDLRGGEQLVHGSQLVARCFEVQEKDLTREVARGKEWQFYTVDLVDDILRTFASADAHAKLRAAFARMMAFDALIGANDRHAQNWGVIESAVRPGPLRFAPIFDTARGLFWNSHEDQLVAMDERGERDAEVEKYARRSTPLIGFETSKRPNHFDVIEHITADPRFRAPVLQVVQSFSPDEMARMLHIRFRRLLSRRRLEWIISLLRLRHATLRRVCGLR